MKAGRPQNRVTGIFSNARGGLMTFLIEATVVIAAVVLALVVAAVVLLLV